MKSLFLDCLLLTICVANSGCTNSIDTSGYPIKSASERTSQLLKLSYEDTAQSVLEKVGAPDQSAVQTSDPSPFAEALAYQFVYLFEERQVVHVFFSLKTKKLRKIESTYPSVPSS